MLRAGEAEERDEQSIGRAAAKIYDILWDGEYTRVDGRRVPVHGDTSKLLEAHGLSQTQRALIQNYRFMSGRIAGTRQVRRSINHLIFSARVFYGLPVFMTFTPSERHSGLMIRLSRHRKRDPAIQIANPEFAPWIGYDAPSLEANSTDGESKRPPSSEHKQADAEHLSDTEAITIDLPEYDLRKLMIARDALCSVEAYHVAIRVVVAQLYGLRMCPDCPHCAVSGNPCMDSFGSSATPMGGSMGRGDARRGRFTWFGPACDTVNGKPGARGARLTYLTAEG